MLIFAEQNDIQVQVVHISVDNVPVLPALPVHLYSSSVSASTPPPGRRVLITVQFSSQEKLREKKQLESSICGSETIPQRKDIEFCPDMLLRGWGNFAINNDIIFIKIVFRYKIFM